MAEENKAEGVAEKKSVLSTIIPLVVVVLVSALLALAIFNFVIRPRLGGEVASEPDPVDALPMGVMTYELPEAQATVLVEGPDQTAPLLIYQLALVCRDLPTHTLIDQRRAFFNARMAELFRNRTRAELNDPYVQDSLLKQARQKANTELRKFDPKGTQEVIEVLYLKYAIFDL